MLQRIFTTEVGTPLWLVEDDCLRIKDLLSWGAVKRGRVLNRMHINAYHARRPMPGLTATEDTLALEVPTSDLWSWR